MHASAAMAIRRKTDSYLTKAKATWDFLLKSGIRGTDNIWRDGIRHQSDGSCTIDGGIFLYSQGLVVSALGLLYAATGDKTYLTEADKTIEGVKAHLTVNGILIQNCDLTNDCDHNEQEYKGIFLKHLMYYLDHANDPEKTRKYAPFLALQSDAVHINATNSDGDPTSLWFQSGDSGLGRKVSSWSVASGLAAHYAAAKYGNC
ncbi:glycoside hydrolase family 76 protein [Mycena crocata]|nr:glycoside hydrolase family 76 protein [Mycena crocata]